MKEKDRQNISSSIEDSKTDAAGKFSQSGTAKDLNPADLPKLSNRSYEDIASTRRLDIPVCKKIPINGRIFVIETSGSETKTEGGIILPHKYRSRKGEDMEIKDVNRYFVVNWDKDEIPQSIQEKLRIGIEVSPILPQEAEEWKLPVIIDFETGNQFALIHYSELAGISETLPTVIER